MASLSITIIGHNEAGHLKELLPQLYWADEVIYVDCGSDDDSLKIAGANGCKVFQRPNNPNLNINKSFAMAQAGEDWIFYLDPDERIPKALADEIKRQINSQAAAAKAAFRLNRRNHYFGRWLKHGSQYPDRQLRLFRRGKARFPEQHVHEKLIVEGPIGELNEDMLHFPYLTVSQYLKKFDFYTGFEADYLFRMQTPVSFGNSVKFLFITPATRFIRRYFFKLGFLDGLPGLFAAVFDALNFVVRYVKLWELYRENE